ncbi:MAG: ZIP family metal transporter [Candidatus Eisenbacteria bacterium]
MIEVHIETLRIFAVIAILLTGLAGGVLSRLMSAGTRSERLLSLGNAFAGGVFLGAGVIHMLPDARDGFAAIQGTSDYPWYALVCTCGFLLILFLEKVCLPNQHGHELRVEGANQSLLQPYVLMMVLSLHSIITGIAFGTESTVAQASVILIAVLAHKGTAAFALGVSMVRTGTDRGRFIRLIAFFSCMTPLGIILGRIAMTAMSDKGARVFEALFDALAAGTFIYVAVIDILGEEFAHPDRRWLKLGAVSLGLGLMAVVAIWT